MSTKIWTKESALRDLKNQWSRVGKPLAFSGESAIYDYYDGALPLEDVRHFLSEQYVYTKFKDGKRVKIRNPFFVHEKRALCEIDLIVLEKHLKEANHNFGYLMCCIDAFTKFAWIEFITTKGVEHVVPAFEKMLSRIRHNAKYPEVLLHDKGKEFVNGPFREVCKKRNIIQRHNSTSYKASHVERFQRTIQKKIYRYITWSGNHHFVDKMPDILQSYNDSVHRTIEMTPSIAEHPAMHYKVRLALSKKYAKHIRKKIPRYKLNQIVRILYDKHRFHRSYKEQYDDTLYRIVGINEQMPQVMYQLARAEDDDEIEGKFYGPEICKVTQDEIYPIETIIEVDEIKKRALVKWQGYGPEHNSYVALSDIKSYQELLEGSTVISSEDEDEDEDDEGEEEEGGNNKYDATTATAATANFYHDSVPSSNDGDGVGGISTHPI